VGSGSRLSMNLSLMKWQPFMLMERPEHYELAGCCNSSATCIGFFAQAVAHVLTLSNTSMGKSVARLEEIHRVVISRTRHGRFRDVAEVERF